MRTTLSLRRHETPVVELTPPERRRDASRRRDNWARLAAPAATHHSPCQQLTRRGRPTHRRTARATQRRRCGVRRRFAPGRARAEACPCRVSTSHRRHDTGVLDEHTAPMPPPEARPLRSRIRHGASGRRPARKPSVAVVRCGPPLCTKSTSPTPPSDARTSAPGASAPIAACAPPLETPAAAAPLET